MTILNIPLNLGLILRDYGAYILGPTYMDTNNIQMAFGTDPIYLLASIVEKRLYIGLGIPDQRNLDPQLNGKTDAMSLWERIIARKDDSYTIDTPTPETMLLKLINKTKPGTTTLGQVVNMLVKEMKQ